MNSENTLTGREVDLCVRWLGTEFGSSMSQSEALRIATACQTKQDAGDSRDYNDIVAETMTEMAVEQDVARCVYAANAGEYLAKQILDQGGTPSRLGQNGDLPIEDYRDMKAQFGEVTVEMERAYKKAFDAVMANAE